MTTGLFATTNAQGLGARRHRRAVTRDKGRKTLAAFAERLSIHGNASLAAREIGKSASYGRTLLQRLIARLGWQAQ